MNNKELIKEYLFERLQAEFDYPITVHAKNRNLVLYPYFHWNPNINIIIHLENSETAFMINFFREGVFEASFQNALSVTNSHYRFFVYDIHSEESMDTACDKVIEYAHTLFSHKPTNGQRSSVN